MVFHRTIRNLSLFILLGFFAPIFSTRLACSEEKEFYIEPPRAMWVWDAKIFQDEAATERLMDFCKSKRIGLIFYTAYKVTGSVAWDYRKFNKTAHKNGLGVHALAGDPRWALLKYHHRCLGWVSDILEFNRGASAEERFDGIHSDVEPYLLGKAWESDHQNILQQYLDMNEKIKDAVSKVSYPLVFAVDVPFWYDDDAAMWVQWRNKLSPANYHLLDLADHIVVMDYRNFTDGENGSIQLVKNEIFYADRAGKKVYIGQEVSPGITPDYTTYGGKSPAYMEAQIKKLTQEYASHPSFAGIAIHHYISYKRFLKEDKE